VNRKPLLLSDRRPRELTLNPLGPTDTLGPLFETVTLLLPILLVFR
jgi:hypothetical protein